MAENSCLSPGTSPCDQTMDTSNDIGNTHIHLIQEEIVTDKATTISTSIQDKTKNTVNHQTQKKLIVELRLEKVLHL